ncbi:MAG: hypothetical protein KBT34_07410 [Prevotella sp.]|nr:hypothetical protein [Candidatus Prevotella equi]
MKKKFLLGLALLASMVMNAQVIMDEPLDAEQTKESTEAGWYEFINLQKNSDQEFIDQWAIEDDGHGTTVLHVKNSNAVEGASWMRAIKFRNLPIEENTTYKVSFDLMGSNQYQMEGADAKKTNVRFALMQGGENNDCTFYKGDGSDQNADISYFQDPSEYEEKGYFHYEATFAHGTKARQAEIYASKNDGRAIPETYFLTINCYNPGDFYIKNVKVEVASGLKIKFNGYDVIKVDFGQPINGKQLAGGKKVALLPNDCVSVLLDGETQAVVRTVEAWSDGSFYIFLNDEEMDEYEGAESAVVTFTNPDNMVQYSEDAAFTGVVKGFEGVEAELDEEMDSPNSYVFEIPTLLSAEPEDGSFNLPLDTKKFSLTFDKLVDLSLIQAKLGSEVLKLVTEGDMAETVEFERTVAGDLTGGVKMLVVTKIFPEAILSDDIYGEVSEELSFGKPQLDPTDVVRTEMTDGFGDIFTAGTFAGSKWIKYNDGAQEEGNSNTRIINNFSGDFEYGFYCGARNSAGWATYGEREDNRFTLTPGKYQYTMKVAGWQSDDRGVKVTVYDEAMEKVIAEKWMSTPVSVPGQGKVDNALDFSLDFKIAEEGNYVIKVWPTNKTGADLGGWAAIVFGSVKVQYIPNAPGIQETKLVDDALEAAKTCYETNNTDRYAGVALDALDKVIKDVEAAALTSPSKCKKAADDLNAAKDVVIKHVAACDTYDKELAALISARDGLNESKYTEHACYATANEIIDEYSSKVLTDDQELAVANDKIIAAKKTCLNIKQLTTNYLFEANKGALALQKVESEYAGSYKSTVDAAFTASDELIAGIQEELKRTVYGKIGVDGYNFIATDEALNETNDSIDMTVFIKNSQICATTWDDKRPQGTPAVDPSSENVPGWNLDDVQRDWDFAFHFPWGGNAQYCYDPVAMPYANVMIASWNTGVDMNQEINNLPVGVYTLCAGASERTPDHNPTAFAYAQTSETELDELLNPVPMMYTAELPNLGGGTEPSIATGAIITGIVVKDGYLKIGVKNAKGQGTPFINEFALFMTGKVDDFDYKEAYTPTAGVKEDCDEVVSVSYINIDGTPATANSKGVVIKVTKMADGTVTATKYGK